MTRSLRWTRKSRAQFLILLSPVLIASAWADDSVSVAVSGFGTAGAAMTSNANYAYYHDSTEYTGASNKIDVGLESKLGLQAVVTFGSSGFSATAQEVVRERGNDLFSPGTEWLYAQYDVNHDLTFRLGRVALATFLLSDSRNVGYASNWMNAPNEVYGDEPFQYLDGGQARWKISAGPVNIKLTGAFGSTSQGISINGVQLNVQAKTAFNVAAAIDYGNMLLRVSETGGDSPFSLALSPALTVATTTKDRFSAVGFQYDDGKALVLSEWAKRTQNNIPLINIPLAASTQWYVAGGWRVGSWTPMATYGVAKGEHSLSDPQGSFGTWSVMTRYDVARNIDLKVQISRPQDSNSRYFLAPSPTTTQRVNVLSFGVDFVF